MKRSKQPCTNHLKGNKDAEVAASTPLLRHLLVSRDALTGPFETAGFYMGYELTPSWVPVNLLYATEQRRAYDILA
jgi:hypothetical protein